MAKIFEFNRYKSYKGGKNMAMLAESRRHSTQEIETLAEHVLINQGSYKIPVNPLTIAKYHGIDVINAEFYENNISGMVTKENDEITIFINDLDPPNRKKFTIAHELGHVFLHLRDTDGDFIDHDVNLYRRNNTDHIEKQFLEAEANKFAAALLMPRRFVSEEWEQTFSVDEMAEKFGVSASSMGFRLQNLGLL